MDLVCCCLAAPNDANQSQILSIEYHAYNI
jgi:hypothetical protein